jgi:hypothetical protein
MAQIPDEIIIKPLKDWHDTLLGLAMFIFVIGCVLANTGHPTAGGMGIIISFILGGVGAAIPYKKKLKRGKLEYEW